MRRLWDVSTRRECEYVAHVVNLLVMCPFVPQHVLLVRSRTIWAILHAFSVPRTPTRTHHGLRVSAIQDIIKPSRTLQMELVIVSIKSFLDVMICNDQLTGIIPGGILPSKRLLGMCRWMGSHFHNWTDYNGLHF